MEPLVSVIIPNYNHSRFLVERIESVLQQTYQNIEIILLDDCSTDDSAEILKTYAFKRKISCVIINRKYSGSTFAQWEKGFTMSRGKYIWIAESDDVAEPSFLEKLVCKLEDTPHSVLAFSYSIFIGRDDDPLKCTWNKSRWFHSNGIYDGPQFVYERLIDCNFLFCASTIVFRRSALEGLPQDYKEFKPCGDRLFWFYICQKGKVVEIPEKLNKFRQYQNKVSFMIIPAKKE